MKFNQYQEKIELENVKIKSLNKIYQKYSYKEYDNLYNSNNITNNFFHFSYYENFIEENYKKKTGTVYTPEVVVELMVVECFKELLKNKTKDDILNIKILDICCGSGNFTEILIKEFFKQTEHFFEDKVFLLNHIINKTIACWDINEKALEVLQKRLKFIFKIDKNENIVCKNILQDKQSYFFDLIIGNPPYGDLLSAQEKAIIGTEEKNIAIDFINYAKQNINENGIVSLIVPHSITRIKNASAFRQSIKNEQSLFKIIDVGNPFLGITLEEVILFFNKKQNKKIHSLSYVEEFENFIPIEKFYNSGFFDKMILYYDSFYEAIHLNQPSFPFNGKRGHDLLKSGLSGEKTENSLMYVLGKNVQKNKILSVKNYDKYIPKNMCKENCIIKQPTLLIGQFGSNLKAAIANENHYPSGGVVVVNYKNMNIEEAKNYLNKEIVNFYLKRYVFNNALLTIHIDGIYLQELPYLENIEEIFNSK